MLQAEQLPTPFSNLAPSLTNMDADAFSLRHLILTFDKLYLGDRIYLSGCADFQLLSRSIRHFDETKTDGSVLLALATAPLTAVSSTLRSRGLCIDYSK